MSFSANEEDSYHGTCLLRLSLPSSSGGNGASEQAVWLCFFIRESQVPFITSLSAHCV